MRFLWSLPLPNASKRIAKMFPAAWSPPIPGTTNTAGKRDCVNRAPHLREYTYVPQGSGIVYITITRGACSSATDAAREGPRCLPAPRSGVPPDRVKIDTW